jgi:hypothetical protein
MTWWRTSKGQARALIGAFGVVALFGMLLAGVNVYQRGDQRQLVVTLEQGVTDADRATLKQACGSLPGVSVVADQGSAEDQYRLPVRFFIGGTTAEQEAALEECIGRYPQLVRGLLTEGGGN